MTEGRLSYNQEQDRYGLIVDGEWYHEGLHCGELLEVVVDGKWTPTRIEMDATGLWYLVGTPYRASGLEYVRARQ